MAITAKQQVIIDAYKKLEKALGRKPITTDFDPAKLNMSKTAIKVKLNSLARKGLIC